MKIRDSIIRILCFGIDYIIILIPIQFVMIGIFQVNVSQAELLYKFLFVAYGALFMEYNHGQTLGKLLGKVRVKDISGAKATLMHTGIRELTKAMYFIPVVGWILALVSLGMMLIRSDGRTLHDLSGNTKVIYVWQERDEVSNDDA